MLALVPILLPLLLVDVLNPVLFATLVFAAGSGRPVANSASMLLGHTLAYFAAGILLSFGVERLAERLANPQAIDIALSGIVGLGLLWMALRSGKDGARTAEEPEWEMTPWRSLGFGAIVSFVGVPFALPYFAAVDQVVRAGLPAIDSLVVLVAYNLAYALPFAVVPVLVAISGDSAKPVLEKISGLLGRATGFLLPWMLGLVGLALVADSLSFFARGTGLW